MLGIKKNIITSRQGSVLDVKIGVIRILSLRNCAGRSASLLFAFKQRKNVFWVG